MDTTGRRIKRLRLKKGISQSQLSKRVLALPRRFFNNMNMVHAIQKKIS